MGRAKPLTVRVLMVCLGNICRSPSAEGVLRAALQKQGMDAWVEVDSAGTAAWHTGKSPDPRSQEHASRRGVDISALRARQIQKEDYEHFDYVLAMDNENLIHLKSEAPIGCKADIRLLMSFAPKAFADGGHEPLPEKAFEKTLEEVPDPYYGGAENFETVLDLVEAASAGLIEHLKRQKNRSHVL